MQTNPWLIVSAKETLLFRRLSVLRKIRSYSHQDSHYLSLQPNLHWIFCAISTPAYHDTHLRVSEVSVITFSPVHLRGHYSQRMSCYAFFKWWRLLDLHLRCLRIMTPFVTLKLYFGTLTSGSLVRVSWQHLTCRRCFEYYAVYRFWVRKVPVGISLCENYLYYTP